jgi:iron complex transport system permease protein
MSYGKLMALLSTVVLILFIASLWVGRDPLPILQAAQELGSDSVWSIILTEIRLPRALIGLFAGATLGLCGAAMQGLLRNPLASPDLIGSSSGAALCAVAVLYFGLTTTSAGLPILPVAGMVGALVATLFVFLLAGRDASISTLILAGVAINTLATAGMSLLLNLAPSPYAMRELVLWTMGDLTDRSMDDFYLMLPFTLLGWGLLIGVGRQLSTLTLGEQTAQTLGVSPSFLRWRIFLAVAFSVGATVSTTGMIGFIGLVVPHLLRPLVGYDAGRLLWVSALGGAALLLAADIGVRLIPTEMPLKVGVLTAMVGAPFFLHLILSARRQHL